MPSSPLLPNCAYGVPLQQAGCKLFLNFRSGLQARESSVDRLLAVAGLDEASLRLERGEVLARQIFGYLR